MPLPELPDELLPAFTKDEPTLALWHAADAIQEALEALMYVRSTTKQRRALEKLWWQVMDRAGEELVARIDRGRGDDRRF